MMKRLFKHKKIALVMSFALLVSFMLGGKVAWASSLPIPPDPGGTGLGSDAPAPGSGRNYNFDPGSNFMNAGNSVQPYYDIGNNVTNYTYADNIARIYVQKGNSINITIKNAGTDCYQYSGGGVVGPDYTNNGAAPTVQYFVIGAGGTIASTTVTNGGCASYNFNGVSTNGAFSITPTTNFNGYLELEANIPGTSVGQGENSYQISISSGNYYGVIGSGSTIFGLGYRAGNLTDGNYWAGWTTFALPFSCNALNNPFSSTQTVYYKDADTTNTYPPGWNSDMIFELQAQLVNPNGSVGAWSTLQTQKQQLGQISNATGSFTFNAQSNYRYQLILANVGVRNTIRIIIPSTLSTLYSKLSERPSTASCSGGDSCTATASPAAPGLNQGTTVTVNLTNTNSSGGPTWPATYELRQVSPSGGAQTLGSPMGPGVTRPFKFAIQPRGSPTTIIFQYALFDGSSANSNLIGKRPLCTVQINWGGGATGLIQSGCSTTQIVNVQSKAIYVKQPAQPAQYITVTQSMVPPYPPSPNGVYPYQYQVKPAQPEIDAPVYWVDIELRFHGSDGSNQTYHQRLNGNPATSPVYNTFKDFNSQVRLYPHISYTVDLWALTSSGFKYDQSLGPDPPPSGAMSHIAGPYQIGPNTIDDTGINYTNICLEVTDVYTDIVPQNPPDPEPGEPDIARFGLTISNQTEQTFNDYSVHYFDVPSGCITFGNNSNVLHHPLQAGAGPPGQEGTGVPTVFDGPLDIAINYTCRLEVHVYFSGKDIDSSLLNNHDYPLPVVSNPYTPATRPYLKAFQSDISAGGGYADITGSCPSADTQQFVSPVSGNSTSGGILTYSYPTTGYPPTVPGFSPPPSSPKGASVDFGALALGIIDDQQMTPNNAYAYGFYSGGNNNVGYNYRSLDFANSSAVPQLGGNLGGNTPLVQEHCAPDYFDTTPKVANPTFASAGGTIDPDALNPNGDSNGVPGQYFYQGSVKLAGTLSAGKSYTIYVKGNLYITGNVSLATSWNPVSGPSPPYLSVIVEGDINIDPAAHTVEGFYVAQPGNGGSGNFSTCSPGGSPADANQVSQGCLSSLNVDGAVLAQHISFLRSNGTLWEADSNSSERPGRTGNVAEVFNYLPSMVVGQPNFATPSGVLTNSPLEGLFSLPPVF